MSSHRILYAGQDYALLDSLNRALTDCMVVRCPDARGARIFLASDLHYSVLLVEAELPDAVGAEVERFARSLPHRRDMPILVLPTTGAETAEVIANVARLLATRGCGRH
jgi:DNA-binding response OmpR family regulator